jgi:hypothetical protein
MLTPMLTLAEIAAIKAEIKRLEQALAELA